MAAQNIKELQKQQRQLQQELEETAKMLKQTKQNETATENKLNMTYTTRISVGSMSKYSAMPPQTPAIIRLEERYSFFIVVLF